MKPILFLVAVIRLASLFALDAAESTDPFTPYLDGKALEVLRDVSSTEAPPENITVRRVVFRSRDDSEIFAVIATPKVPGRHPGMLVLHGGGGSAEVDKAMAWAQRGYVAVAPDLPGIAEPKKLTESKGRWSGLKYGEGRYVAQPDASASVIVDAVLAAMKSLALLRAQPEVDATRIGVVGISWGGYMTTMVCGLAADQVRAGFAVYGCGFYELTSQQPTLLKMADDERARWLKFLDAGRRAPGIKAAFFCAGAANDFFFWPPAVQATLDAIPGETNHLFAPNESHRVSLPGGSVFPDQAAVSFTPTAFQPYPTPSGSKANWLAMEVTFFDYYLNGIGQPFPRVEHRPADDDLTARFEVTAPGPISRAEVYWSTTATDWTKRRWFPIAAAHLGGNRYEAKLPPESNTVGAAWFAVVSDGRPVTVSSELVTMKSAVKPAVFTPSDYQVIQRSAGNRGVVTLSGTRPESADIEWRMSGTSAHGSLPTEWQKVPTGADATLFNTQIALPAGGWYRLQVRAMRGGEALGESLVEHVGLGEVFVVAGQSNSANHGEEAQRPATGLVAALREDGQWQVANDPQPGASGNRGSFLPAFGDAIAEHFKVPVGIVACGVGATSVREWLPKGATFPNPPTLESRVSKLPSGQWESKGTIFPAFTARMKQLGPHGFRAVLWHQGESDANQKDPTRTLPGELYRESLEKLVRGSRRAIGWDAPWFVAQASYHVPGDESSPDIRSAQASLWKAGIALEGPDTDALKGDLRENGGKGVHFSGAGQREHAARWATKVAPWLDEHLK